MQSIVTCLNSWLYADPMTFVRLNDEGHCCIRAFLIIPVCRSYAIKKSKKNAVCIICRSLHYAIDVKGKFLSDYNGSNIAA